MQTPKVIEPPPSDLPPSRLDRFQTRVPGNVRALLMSPAERFPSEIPTEGKKRNKKPKSGGNQSCSDCECQPRVAAGSSPGVPLRPPRCPRIHRLLRSALPARPGAAPAPSLAGIPQLPAEPNTSGRHPAPPASSRRVRGGGGAAPAVPARPGSRRREIFSFILRFTRMNFSWSWRCQSLSPRPVKTSSLF
ncbi:translation initiation factor IF-2-like [Vidua macroura]|uniref:translation initiation factor IF-2-like n=1 Tax=Vidua macroura TaxID=187451 RepID=UPI0023A8932F|nr:translation initiation factor IF-2-like [Vidua macroura]